MSTIESADQATDFLDRAQDLLTARRDDEAYRLLEAVEQSGLLPTQHRPRLLWLLGEACYQGGGYDAAAQYYEQAVSAGDAALAQQARARLAEFGRMDTASDVAAGGVDTAAELEQVVAAGEEALARNDLATAYELFSRAYQYPSAGADIGRMGRVALGLGKTLFFQRHYDQAREYLVYVGQLSSTGPAAEEATRVLAELDQLQGAAAGTADGVQAAEVRQTFQAGLDAFRRRDYPTAIQMFGGVHQAAVVDGTTKAAAAHNLGASYRNNGDFDAAIRWYEEAVRLGSPDSQRQIDRLRSADAAMEQIGEDLITDI